MLFIEKLTDDNFSCNGKLLAKDSLRVDAGLGIPLRAISIAGSAVYDAELWDGLNLIAKIPAKSVVTHLLVDSATQQNALEKHSLMPSDFVEYLHELEMKLSKVSLRLLFTEWEAFESYLNVWLLNMKDLEAQLRNLHSNETMAIEMIQNVRESSIRDEQLALLDKNIYNYLASFVSLVDVARTLVGKYHASALNVKYQTFREFFNRPENVFINKLRNYVLHHKLPIAGQQFNFKVGESFEFKVYADCKEMLSSSTWTSDTRKFLEDSPPTLDLGRMLLRHMHQAKLQWLWLASMRDELHAYEIFEYNELVTEARWAQSGGTLSERGLKLN